MWQELITHFEMSDLADGKSQSAIRCYNDILKFFSRYLKEYSQANDIGGLPVLGFKLMDTLGVWTSFSRSCGHLHGDGLLCQAEEALIAGHFTGETGQFVPDIGNKGNRPVWINRISLSIVFLWVCLPRRTFSSRSKSSVGTS